MVDHVHLVPLGSAGVTTHTGPVPLIVTDKSVGGLFLILQSDIRPQDAIDATRAEGVDGDEVEKAMQVADIRRQLDAELNRTGETALISRMIKRQELKALGEDPYVDATQHCLAIEVLPSNDDVLQQASHTLRVMHGETESRALLRNFVLDAAVSTVRTTSTSTHLSNHERELLKYFPTSFSGLETRDRGVAPIRVQWHPKGFLRVRMSKKDAEQYSKEPAPFFLVIQVGANLDLSQLWVPPRFAWMTGPEIDSARRLGNTHTRVLGLRINDPHFDDMCGWYVLVYTGATY